MNNGKHQKKAQRESSDEFCKRLGIRTVNAKGGMEFVPHRDSQKASKGEQAAAWRNLSWRPEIRRAFLYVEAADFISIGKSVRGISLRVGSSVPA
jgi:hypothetical protein